MLVQSCSTIFTVVVLNKHTCYNIFVSYPIYCMLVEQSFWHRPAVSENQKVTQVFPHSS